MRCVALNSDAAAAQSLWEPATQSHAHVAVLDCGEELRREPRTAPPPQCCGRARRCFDRSTAVSTHTRLHLPCWAAAACRHCVTGATAGPTGSVCAGSIGNALIRLLRMAWLRRTAGRTPGQFQGGMPAPAGVRHAGGPPAPPRHSPARRCPGNPATPHTTHSRAGAVREPEVLDHVRTDRVSALGRQTPQACAVWGTPDAQTHADVAGFFCCRHAAQTTRTDRQGRSARRAGFAAGLEQRRAGGTARYIGAAFPRRGSHAAASRTLSPRPCLSLHDRCRANSEYRR